MIDMEEYAYNVGYRKWIEIGITKGEKKAVEKFKKSYDSIDDEERHKVLKRIADDELLTLSDLYKEYGME